MITIESHKLKLKERVEAGVKLLDEKGPPRWFRKVHLKTLAMNSLEECVLGQLYGGYVEGEKALNLRFKDAMDYGFSISFWEGMLLGRRSVWTGDTEVVSSPGFKILTEFWKEAIRAKRAA